MDAGAEKLGAKIRKAETERVPHMFVIGKKKPLKMQYPCVQEFARNLRE
ncbi:MAG: His/Gly/Thr/Pro-type tRNA ligase C-terminal domain-containing protein [Bacilli bacterium]